MSHTRTAFRDAALGPWSSHPAFLGRRSRTWALLGFLPLGAGIVLFLASWQFGAVTLVDLAMSWTTWFPLVLALVVFGFSASATALLVGRASTVGAFQLKGSGDGHIRLWTFLAAVGLVSGVAFALTRGAALQASLTPESIASFRLAGHLIGTVPVFLLLVGLEFGGSPIDEWGESPERLSLGQGLRRAVVLFSVFVGYLLPVIWIDRVAAALDLYKAHLQDPSVYSSDDVAAEFMRWVPGLTYDRSASGNGTPVLSVLEGAQDFIAALAILVPLCGLTGFVFLSAVAFVATAKSRKVPVGTEEIVRREGYDLRPTGESWDPNDGGVARPRVSKGERFRPVDSENSSAEGDGGQDDAASEPPPWLAGIQQSSVGSQPLEWGEVRRAPPLEFSPSSGRSDLAHLFTTAFDPESGVGTPPTKDQVDALEHFDRQFSDFLVAEDREGQCVFPSTDLLVVGAPGSGRTTLLLAVALNSVVLRGQSVLLLAPTPEKAHLYVRRLRDLASRGGVGWHVAVGQIDEDAVRSWADPIGVDPAAAAVRPPHRSPIGSLPDILVGTPHDYERCLFGADIHHAPVRRALLRLQVVLVEDVTSYSTAERRHLPFLLEKHRLVLASEHLPAQFLVVAPDLTKDAADYLKQRLFGEKAPAGVRRLRPSERPAPWLLDVAASDPTEAVEALAAAGAAADLRVVLWRPGVGKTDVAKLSSRLSGSGGRVQVVSDLDELTAEDGIETDLAVYRAHTARQQTLALSSHVSGAATVLVRVTRPGALIPLPESEKTLPVLPSVESEALFVSHLMSAVHYLSPFSPAPRDIFARIGLRPACQLTNLRTREVDYEVTPGLTLRLDPPEDKAEAVAAARRQTWSFVALHLDGYDERQGAPPPPRPVEMFRPLPRGREIRGASGRDRVYLGEAEVDERSIASWVTQQNESLDRMDLACADDLMHRHGANRFVPREIRDENGNLVVRGEPFRDKDLGESYFPVFEASIQLPQDVKVDPEQGGVAPRYLRWVSVRDPDLGAPQGQFWLAATYDVTGMVSRLAHPAPLHYGIRLGALLLGPERIIAGSILSERQERTRQAFVGCWTTRRDQHAGASGLRPRPWPVLSLAVTSGLRDVLPGLFDYCRLVAHRGPADGVNDDRAFVLCYEPSSTRGTVAEAMRKLLMDTELTLEVLTAARRMLADVDPHATEALANLMVDAGLLMGDGWYDPEVGGEALLMEDTEGAIKLLDGALADVRATKERGARGRQQRQGVGEEGAG